MKRLLALLFLACLSGIAFAQTAPTGGCNATDPQQTVANVGVYGCQNGTWTLLTRVGPTYQPVPILTQSSDPANPCSRVTQRFINTTSQAEFYCGTDLTWHASGGSGGGAVASVFGRTGSVVPTSGDYSFPLISGNFTLAQFPTIANNTVLGNIVGSTAVPTALTAANLSTLLSLAPSATTDTTNATNISSGTLAAARVATLNQSTTGNAATATALATTPTPCSAGQAPTGVLASGNSTGCTTYIQTDAVPTVFGRAGAVVAAGGDYTAAQVTNAASTASANTFGAFNQTFGGDFLMNSGTNASEQYHLEGRVGVGIPVPNLTATATNTAIAFDIFPHGAAGDFNTIGNAWEDICNTDINTSGANYSCLRMGIHAAASSNVFIRSNGAGTGLTGNLDLQELGGMVGINLGANVQPTSELQVAFPKTTALGSGANWNTAQLALYDSTNMAAGVGGAIGFVGNFVTSTTSFRFLAGIGAAKTNGTSADQSGDLVGYSAVSATGYPTEGFRLSNSLGTFGIKLGNKFACTHGSNGTCGVITLTAGAATISTTAAATLAASGGAGDIIHLECANNPATTTTAACSSQPFVSAITPGTSFVIGGTATDTVYWEIRHIN